jgi:transcriptional regulator with XRE-family HTH domain
MRGKTTPEDKIVGVVLERLKKEVGFTYYEMAVETGIPATTLQGIASSKIALGNPGRISLLANYFQRIHALDYVDEKYFLTGNEEDRAVIEGLRQQERIQERNELPPFFELTEAV